MEFYKLKQIFWYKNIHIFAPRKQSNIKPETLLMVSSMMKSLVY